MILDLFFFNLSDNVYKRHINYKYILTTYYIISLISICMVISRSSKIIVVALEMCGI